MSSLAAIDFAESSKAVISWINNITMSLHDVCFMMTDGSQEVNSSMISLQVDTDTGIAII